MEGRLGPQGRLVIPVAIRRALALETGTRLLFAVEDGRLVVESSRAQARRLRGAWRQVADRPAGALGQLEAERRAEAELEAAEASGDAPAAGAARRRLSSP